MSADRLRRSLVSACALVAMAGGSLVLSGSPTAAAAVTPLALGSSLLAHTATSWRDVVPPAPPAPADPGESLGPISCPTAGECESIGTALDTAGLAIPAVFTETGGTWTTETLPVPAGLFVGFAQPAAISCTAVGSCVAVFTTGNLGPLAVFTQSAGSWTSTTAPTAIPGGSISYYRGFGGLWCADSSDCVMATTFGKSTVHPAVITDTAGTLSAKILWAPKDAQLSSRFGDPQLGAISCTSVGNCTAVGRYIDTSGHTDALIETETAGGTWQPRRAPTPVAGDQAELSSVICDAPGSCVAVGDAAAQSDRAEIVTESGGTWSAATAPVPSGLPASSLTALLSLSCPAPGDCVATGLLLSISGFIFTEQGWTAEESSGAWSAQSAPLPAGAPASSDSLVGAPSCSSPGNCAVVGSYSTFNGADGLVDQEVNGTWSATNLGIVSPVLRPGKVPARLSMKLPSLAEHQLSRMARSARVGGRRAGLNASPSPSVLELFLNNVVCPSDGSCTAVGGYFDSYGNLQGLVASITPTASTTATAPQVASSGFRDRVVRLNQVTCPVAGWCVGVGAVMNVDFGLVGVVVVTESNSTWTTQQLSTPAGSIDLGSQLTHVSCSAKESCVAIGADTPTSSSSSGLFAASDMSGSWATTALALPAGVSLLDGVGPSGLSCKAGNCVALASAGGQFSSGPAGPAAIEWEHAGKWSVSTAPQPANGASTPAVSLESAACPTRSSCIVTGHYVATKFGPRLGLILTGSGTTWKATETPTPKGIAQNNTDLTSVACISAGHCVAVSRDFDSSGNTGAFFVSEKATGGFTAVQAPLPANGEVRRTQIGSVSCSTKSCLGVGSYFDTKGQVTGLLVTGSGTSWKPVEAPWPSAVATPSWAALTQASCAAGGYCGAVGGLASGSASVPDLVGGTVGSWSAKLPALPRSGQSILTLGMRQITCPATASCVALGLYFKTTGIPASVIEVQH